MTVVDVWKQPVVKLINFLAEFFWIQIWCVFWLEWPELNLQVIGQTMVIIVYRFFLINIYQCRSCSPSLEIRICSFIELTKEISPGIWIFKSWLIAKSVPITIGLTGM